MGGDNPRMGGGGGGGGHVPSVIYAHDYERDMDWATVITYIWYRDLILKIQEFYSSHTQLYRI